jgi:hypothetical protein
VHDLAAARIDDLADLAQRSQVRLRRLELAGGDGREGRVLAVGAEQPRVVREAGAEPARTLQRADGRRVLLALVGVAQPQPASLLDGVREVLLAPLNAALELAITG